MAAPFDSSNRKTNRHSWGASFGSPPTPGIEVQGHRLTVCFQHSVRQVLSPQFQTRTLGPQSFSDLPEMAQLKCAPSEAGLKPRR